MSAASNKPINIGPTRKERSNEPRDPHGRGRLLWKHHEPVPAAGAHASRHLVNEDATPGAGALPSYTHAFGREVDGGAG